jgi:hypothetical protein
MAVDQTTQRANLPASPRARTDLRAGLDILDGCLADV